MGFGSTFTFERWQGWLERKASEQQTSAISAECKRGGEPTSKPCCSFRLWKETAFGQFDVWATGETDDSVMDARSKEFIRHSWGMKLDDLDFEAAFEEFRSSLTAAR